MAAPLKPWELSNSVNVLNRNIPVSSITRLPQDQLVNTDVAFGGGLGGGGSTQNAPPIPPRQTSDFVSASRSGFSGMNSMNSMYSSSPYMSTYSSPYSYSSPFGGYGGYGGYGGMGGMGFGGGYGANYRSDNQFVQLAEENYRNALQPIEALVHTIGSISMMLQTTFYTLNSSFHSVIGVADQFAKMKEHMGHFFSIFALFRSLKWLYRRVLALLGLIPPNSASEVWEEAESSLAKEIMAGSKNSRKSRLPTLVFLALIFGTPYLLFKLLMLATPQPPNHNEWASGKIDHMVGEVVHDFIAERNQEIAVKAGQHIKIAPKELQPNVGSNWILASADGKTGFVPVNYIKNVAKVKGNCTEDHRNMDKLFEETSRMN